MTRPRDNGSSWITNYGLRATWRESRGVGYVVHSS